MEIGEHCDYASPLVNAQIVGEKNAEKCRCLATVSQPSRQPTRHSKGAISMTTNACGARVHHRLLRENALPDTFINRTLRKDRVESDEIKEKWISYVHYS